MTGSALQSDGRSSNEDEIEDWERESEGEGRLEIARGRRVCGFPKTMIL